jgi:hypothetical protein
MVKLGYTTLKIPDRAGPRLEKVLAILARKELDLRARF